MVGQLQRWKDNHVKPLFQRKGWKLTKFEYIPLDRQRDEIRLLELLPGMQGEPLRAKVFNKSTEHAAGAYETISYVWGDPEKTASIEIQRHILSIPSSTAAALRRMRYTKRSRILWIDAICINQEDVAERGQQVAVMGSIYSRSCGNLVHLTDDVEESRLIHDVVNELDEDARSATNNYDTFCDTIWNKDIQNYRKAHRVKLQHLDLEALSYLILLPWFRRLWVVQEAYMAPSTTCCLGSVDIPLLTILRSLRWAFYAGHTDTILSRLDHANSVAASSGVSCTGRMFEMLCGEQFGVSIASWRYLLRFSCSFEKSDPKDAVYALLGLSDGAFDGLGPDYTRPLGTILQDATRAALQQDNDLEVLSMDRCDDDLYDELASSWAVRADHQYTAVSHSATLRSSTSNAAGGLDEPSTLRETTLDLATLRLEGLRVGVIATRTRRFTVWTHWGIRQWLLDSIPVIQAAVNEQNLSYSGLDYASIVGGSSTLPGGEPTREDLQTVGSWLQRVINSAEETIPATNIGQIEQKTNAFDTTSQRLQFFTIRHRRLFATSLGRIGLGPGAMRTGDIVTVLRGSRVPLILRPFGTEYKLVGAARVHGIMNGEAVTEHRAKGGKEEIFVLR